jgi:hypothetical protein
MRIDDKNFWICDLQTGTSKKFSYCDSGMSPRNFGFAIAIAEIKKKFACPLLTN